MLPLDSSHQKTSSMQLLLCHLCPSTCSTIARKCNNCFLKAYLSSLFKGINQPVLAIGEKDEFLIIRSYRDVTIFFARKISIDISNWSKGCNSKIIGIHIVGDMCHWN